MTSIYITPAEELCDAWDAAANESHSLTDVITTGDIVVGAKAMRRLKKAIEAITGCQPGILADYRGPAPTPPVTGSADGNLEPGPALPNGLIGGRNVNNRLTTLEERSDHNWKVNRALDVRVDDLSQWTDETRMTITDLQRQVKELTERFEAHSHEIDIHSTDRPTALAGQIGGTA